MSRFRTLLISASLALAPLAANADPAPAPQVQHFEWSMSTGHGRLGIAILGLTPELRAYFGAAQDRGVLVAHVEPGSPAARAGIQVGDVVTDVAGHPVGQAGEVIEALAGTKKGQAAAISVVRDHKVVALSPTLTEDPAPFDRAFSDGAWPDRAWFDDMFDHARRASPPPRARSGKTSTAS